MALWKKMWLLFTAIWLTVAALNVVTILAFADEVEHQKALVPVAFGVLVPALAYALGWAWAWLRRGKKSRAEPEKKEPEIGL